MRRPFRSVKRGRKQLFCLYCLNGFFVICQERNKKISFELKSTLFQFGTFVNNVKMVSLFESEKWKPEEVHHQAGFARTRTRTDNGLIN